MAKYYSTPPMESGSTLIGGLAVADFTLVLPRPPKSLPTRHRMICSERPELIQRCRTLRILEC